MLALRSANNVHVLGRADYAYRNTVGRCCTSSITISMTPSSPSSSPLTPSTDPHLQSPSLPPSPLQLRLLRPRPSSLYFVAESTRYQMSSRLLCMKSANALLELPKSAQIHPSGTILKAMLISDIRNFPLGKTTDDTSVSPHNEHAVGSTQTISVQIGSSSPEHVKVAILTVSNTVAQGLALKGGFTTKDIRQARPL